MQSISPTAKPFWCLTGTATRRTNATETPENSHKSLEALLKIAQELTEEDQRSISEGLSEEELAVFDLLTRPQMSFTDKEKDEVKKIARNLLDTLKTEKLVLDWRKRQQARASVRVVVEEKLEELPDVYTDEMYWHKCDAVYQHIYDHYYGSGRSVYAQAS